MTTNRHKITWDENEQSYIENVPEKELPDCMNNKHNWRIAIPFKLCILCGKTELLKPDYVSKDVREVSRNKENK